MPVMKQSYEKQRTIAGKTNDNGEKQPL